MQKLAEALRERRGDTSLRGVARELGVATGTAESWLKGWRQPEVKNLPKLSSYLEVPIDQIIHWVLDDYRENKVFSTRTFSWGRIRPALAWTPLAG